MADHIAIPGEFCTLSLAGVEVAASNNFTMNFDRATYGNMVARGTSKWRTIYPADMGGTFDIDGLIVVQDTTPVEKQFDDLFTYAVNGTSVALIFTLRTATASEKTFIYSCSAIIQSLTTAAPQFGEATYAAGLIVSGAIQQTQGTVS